MISALPESQEQVVGRHLNAVHEGHTPLFCARHHFFHFADAPIFASTLQARIEGFIAVCHLFFLLLVRAIRVETATTGQESPSLVEQALCAAPFRDVDHVDTEQRTWLKIPKPLLGERAYIVRHRVPDSG